MPYAWPAGLKIQEARLRIVAPAYGHESAANRKGFYGPSLHEMWAGEIVAAPLSRNSEALRLAESFVAKLRGRLQPFNVPCAAGFMTYSGGTATGTVTTTGVRGSPTIAVSLTAGRRLLPGTLLMIGSDSAASTFQTVELLEAVNTTGSAQTITVAPRIRHPFAVGQVVTTAGAYVRMRLLTDDGASVDFDIRTGRVVIRAVEAVAQAGVLT